MLDPSPPKIQFLLQAPETVVPKERGRNSPGEREQKQDRSTRDALGAALPAEQSGQRKRAAEHCGNGEKREHSAKTTAHMRCRAGLGSAEDHYGKRERCKSERPIPVANRMLASCGKSTRER